ncbi:MAG: amino acid ABC transporter substrate-binding protein [Candidimonas sp.]|nr:MAG: amino acid ABC transporter substrate-binding protein [Candidimonas sp.]TAM19637.1 MAG: amino acid ABC transporter substrate-binding protein [Candidimonas sp.]
MTDQNSSSTSRRKFLLSVSAAGGAVVLSTTLPRRAYAAAPPAINLGQIAPMTGSAAEFGPYYRDAAQLAVNQINKAATQVFGGPIIAKLVTVDTTTLPTVGVQAARKMVDIDKVPAIVGGWSSGVTIAVASSVSIPAGVLQIANGATSPLITVLPADATADLLFRTTASDALQGIVAAQLVNGEIVKGYKFKRVSTIYINNPYGQGLSNSFAKAFEHRGGKVLAQVPHPEQVQPTYKSQLATALQDKPELLLAVTYPAQTAVALKESRDIFNFTSWQFTDANASLDVVKAIGAKDLEGKMGTATGEDTTTASYKSFAKQFTTDFHHDTIPPFTASTYDAAMVIGLALAKVIANGQTDARKITGTALRDQLRVVSNPPGEAIEGGDEGRILEMMKMIKAGKKINYTGAAGPCDFDKTGDVITPINIWKFADGKVETVRTMPASGIPKE